MAGEQARLAAEKQQLAVERERVAAESARVAEERDRVTALKRDVETKANPPKERTVAITGATPYGANGYTRFTLENGEVWDQIERARVRLGRGSPDVLVIKAEILRELYGHRK